MTLSPNTPLSAENVGLLKAGDWLRCSHWNGEFFTAGQEYQILDTEGGVPMLLTNLGDREEVYLFDQFTFVDRPALSPPAEGEVDRSPPWPPGPDNAKREGWKSYFSAKPRDRCPFPPNRDDLRKGYEAGWDAASESRMATITPTPTSADHIGDATEKVDWERVGPKLVEALEAAIPTLESDYGEAQDCADEAWIERAWQRLKTARNALTIAQTESKA